MSSWTDVQKRASAAEFEGACGTHAPCFAGNRILGDCLYGCEDGKKGWLKGCRITIFTEMGRLKIVVRDPNSKLVGFSTLNGEASLSDAIEHAITSGSIDWRKDRQVPGRGL